MTSLDLHNNNLKTFPDLKWCVDLTFVDVSNNNLTSIPGPRLPQGSLTHLDISNNQLLVFPDLSFKPDFLDASHNPFIAYHTNHFDIFQNDFWNSQADNNLSASGLQFYLHGIERIYNNASGLFECGQGYEPTHVVEAHVAELPPKITVCCPLGQKGNVSADLIPSCYTPVLPGNGADEFINTTLRPATGSDAGSFPTWLIILLIVLGTAVIGGLCYSVWFFFFKEKDEEDEVSVIYVGQTARRRSSTPYDASLIQGVQGRRVIMRTPDLAEDRWY